MVEREVEALDGAPGTRRRPAWPARSAPAPCPWCRRGRTARGRCPGTGPGRASCSPPHPRRGLTQGSTRMSSSRRGLSTVAVRRQARAQQLPTAGKARRGSLAVTRGVSLRRMTDGHRPPRRVAARAGRTRSRRSERAVELGADGIELDVRRTADGVARRAPRRRARRRPGDRSTRRRPNCRSTSRRSPTRSTPAPARGSTSRSRTTRREPDFDPRRRRGRRCRGRARPAARPSGG